MQPRSKRMVRLAVLLAIIVIGLVASQPGKRRPADPPVPPPSTEKQPPTAQEDASSGEKPYLVRDVVIKDLDGNVAYEGNVDLSTTLERIDAGRRLDFRNDGATFQNREQRLPRRPGSYYREWVHPTPDLPGAGPQRIVTGDGGEAYYTPDHYRSFQRLR